MLFLMRSGLVAAEEGIPSDSAVAPVAELQKMIVTTSRYKRLMETAQSITVIRPEEWMGTGKSLADVIAEQTGVQTRRFGGRGSFQTVSIRGVEGSEVLILLDGIPLNSAMGGAVDLGKINPSRLSGIEVYRSFIPARYGGNGLGGLINLISARHENETGADLHASMGNYHTQDHHMLVSHSPGNGLSVLGLLSFENSENDFPYLDRNNTFMGTLIDPTLDDSERVMSNNRYTAGYLLLHPSLRLNDKSMLFTNVTMSYFKAHQPAEEGKRNLTAYYTEKVTSVNARIVNDSVGRFSVEPAVGYTYRDGYRFSTAFDEGAGASHSTLSGPRSHAKVGSIEQMLSVPVTVYYRPANVFVIESMVQLSGADIDPTVNTTGGSHGDWHCSEAAGSAALDAIAAIDPVGLIVGASGRGSYTTTEGGLDGYTLRTIPDADTVTAIWSVKGGVSLHLQKDAVLIYCNGGRFSNEPSLRQRYGAQGAHNPNPTLVPETGYAAELGVKIDCRDFYSEVCGFYNRSYDKIITVFDGRQASSMNCAGALVYGVESSVVWSISDWVQLDGRITLQHTENLSREYNWYGRRLPNEPEITVQEAVLIGPFKGFSLRYGVDLKSFYFRNPANTNADRVPKYEYGKENDFWELFHHGTLEWKALRHLTISLSAINVTNGLLTSGELAYSGEGGNSLVLVPANQLHASVEYSF